MPDQTKSLRSEIKKAQRTVAILKKLVHVASDKDFPLARENARLHQIQLKHFQDYLKELAKFSKERKKLLKQQQRLQKKKRGPK